MSVCLCVDCSESFECLRKLIQMVLSFKIIVLKKFVSQPFKIHIIFRH